MEFAEDVGNTGAAISITPGDTAPIEETQWLPNDEGDVEEGTMIVKDRGPKKRYAHVLHEAERILPDMGDRSPGRPRTRQWLQNPMNVLREDYRQNPVFTLAAAAGIVTVAWIVGNDLEREYKSRRGRGVAGAASAVPEATAATGGDEGDKVVKNVEDVVTGALGKIEAAINTGVKAIEDTVKEVAE